jgi:glutamate dehydrogenase/leucine dehydrogenase
MVLRALEAEGHEQLVFSRDEQTGLRCIVAIHSTRLGPGLGGVRIRRYDSEDAAVEDVMRLSQAMSYKNACAGLDFGGAKGVILGPLPDDRLAVMRAMGRIVEGLGGRYVATEDMGMTESDVATMRQETQFAVGMSRRDGGSGDPSPHTAEGVFVGMRAALRAAGLGSDFADVRVAVQGCGKVGLGLIARLVQAGAQVLAADTDEVGVNAARTAGAQIVSPDEILAVQAEVLAPCAVGAVLNERSIPGLRCQVIAGGANNQLATPEDANRLKDRGIVYAPDFVINAGGVINVGDELAAGGYDERRVATRVAAIEQTLDDIFREAEHSGSTTAQLAVKRAQRRIRAGR